ncbi:haloacid dehalogenase-like hydrolase [Oxalobacter vibrioformis]|uniref:Haloacid dehalogenase-like hydrolase n=1 Tax=Oxalobacter vibrioformis TaxID=933080 RepID=A0A9E9M1M6_9BURK|nr:HAD family hydrolase [Oxalobacter vibrioformis]NLC23997.1 haloacid dehalogenase-like hydrolase [Oxalobacter sp.]WAW11148.1 haloacid dehalogenase-like hydrolase [Oxalobacter vibrioformis]
MTENLIPVAIAYDFDGTLSPGNMQEYDFIPKLGVSPRDFWEQASALAETNQMDTILAYMWRMIREANIKDISVRKSDFHDFGKQIKLFPGVSDWFARINIYAHSKGIRLEHFIISSGIREMIEATPIYPEFRKVYASAFMFDHNGVACWPALAVNYTTKTQYLFRINKGSLDVHDNSVINKFVPMEERPVPFENILFIGDGETDIPCMRLVKEQGGHAIAVYPPDKEGAQAHARKLVEEGRATLFTPADYRQGKGIDLAVRAILDRIEATSRIR